MAGYCPKTQLHKNNLDIQTIKQRFGIIGTDSKLERAIFTAMQVAPTDISVLIIGESGTGKEVFSQIIHQLSPRHKNGGKFIAVNCGAIPEGTIDSELFGHEKGAFTSAIKQKIGKFEQANGGTLFLDEIGDMDFSVQAKVLRALQENKITRVGGEKDIKVDVRVVSATNKNLEQEIENKRFRLDLYHRLNVINIHLPSLNQRGDDVKLIAVHIINEICKDYKLAKKTWIVLPFKHLQTTSGAEMCENCAMS